MPQEDPHRPKVLVVEDERLTAAEIAQALRAGGAEVVGPSASVADALALVARHADLAGAVLDINLNGRASYPVAEALERRKVPFVFATGYEAESVLARWRCAIRCGKPLDPDAVVGTLARAMRRERRHGTEAA